MKKDLQRLRLQAIELQAQRGSDAQRVATQLAQLEAARLARAALDARTRTPELDPVQLVRLVSDELPLQLPGGADSPDPMGRS